MNRARWVPGSVFLTLLTLLFLGLNIATPVRGAPPSQRTATPKSTLVGTMPITSANAASVSQQGNLGRGNLRQVAWSPGSKLLAVTSSLGVWLYATDAFKAQPHLLKCKLGCDGLAFSPNGSILAAGGGDGVI